MGISFHFFPTSIVHLYSCSSVNTEMNLSALKWTTTQDILGSLGTVDCVALTILHPNSTPIAPSQNLFFNLGQNVTTQHTES